MASAAKASFVPRAHRGRNHDPGLLQRVRGRLLLRQYSVKRIAKTLGRSEPYITNILAGRDRTPPLQQAIANLAAMHPADLFEHACHPTLRKRAGGSR